MANYATLKAAIQQVIKANGNNEITGNLLQQQLLAMVNSLGVGYQFAGIATPATNPGTPDQNVFYLASTAGTYANFNSLVLAGGEIAILRYNGTWSKDSTGAASLEKVNQLGQIALAGINFADAQINPGAITIEAGSWIFGKYLSGADQREYDAYNRAYTKNPIECNPSSTIRISLGAYTATIYFYAEDLSYISYSHWFESFSSFGVPANAKYFRVAIGSDSELTAVNYVPITFDYGFANEDIFCDIKQGATPFVNSVMNPSTMMRESNSNFSTFVIPNLGYSKVRLNAAFYDSNSFAIGFFSAENLGNENLISFVKGVGSGTSGKVETHIADVPNGCKMIVFGARTASNPTVEILGALSNDILSNNISNVRESISNDVMNRDEMRYGYFNSSSGALYPQLGASSVAYMRYIKTAPHNAIYINNPAGYTVANYWYDKDKNLLSFGWFDSGKDILIAPENAYYLRIAFRNATIVDFVNVTIKNKGVFGDIVRLTKDNLLEGYVNSDGVSFVRNATQRLFAPFFIPVNGNSNLRVSSADISTIKVDCYDRDYGFMYYLGWFVTSKQIHIPNDVCYIRISFGQGIYLSSLTEDIVLENTDATTISIIQAQRKNLFARRYEIAHLFINESVQGTNVTIPSQSLFDIEVAARLGFSSIELNCHSTSDGKFICIHGASGKFGNQVEHIDGVTDISNTAINSVTLDYIKQYVRYKSIYPKYRTSIPTLNEACECAKAIGISVDLSATGLTTEQIIVAIDTVRGYFGENFIAGAYGVDNAIFIRSLFKGAITYYSDANTVADIDTICKKVGAPYLHCMSPSAISGLTDVQLKEITAAIHKNNCLVSFADAYTTREAAIRLFDCGFDIAAGPDFSINDFGSGNICNLSGDIEFGDFETDGTETDNNLVLSVGQTITPGVSLNSHFLCGGYMQILFTGTLNFQLGKINETLVSDGKLPIILSSFVMNQTPSFVITAMAETSISQLIYKATKF